jgi:hypothetical protein
MVVMKTAGTDPAESGETRELRLDRLVGREVVAGNNQRVGRLEEFRAEEQRGTYAITEYVIGVAGLFERLGVGFRLIFGKRGRGYVARWDQLDISNPEHPRLTCRIDELRKL